MPPALLLLAALASQGSDAAPPPALHWPRWRGPTWDGVAAPDAAPPLTWSEAEHVRWKAPLPGSGASTPLVVGELVVVTAAVEVAPPDPGGAAAQRALVLAFDRATGAERWRRAVHEGVPHEQGHAEATHASPSPSCDGRRIVASFGSRGVYALDLDGAVLWSRDLGRMRTLEGFGEASSPALAGGLVVVQWDHEDGSALLALDAATGEERWRTPRAADSSWGSPVVVDVGGRAQVVVTGSDATRGYDLADGAEVWSCGGMSKNPVSTAVVRGGAAWVTNAYQGTLVQALRLERDGRALRGDLAAADGLAWTRDGVGSYVPSPVVHGGRLYLLRGSAGVLGCLDAATGEPAFTDRRLPRLRKVYASPIVAAGRLYVPGRDGATVVLRAEGDCEVLATNTLDDTLDASPVAVADALILRGRRHLYCLAEPAPRER